MEMQNETLLQELDYMVAQDILEHLLDDIQAVKKSVPRNFSKFAAAQFTLKRLDENLYAEAARLVYQKSSFQEDCEEDPLEKVKRTLSQVKNPTKQGKGIKKEKHIRPRGRNTRDPLQLSLRLNRAGRHKKQKDKVKTKTKKIPKTVVTQLSLFK